MKNKFLESTNQKIINFYIMKKTKKIIKICFVAVSLFIGAKMSKAQTISNHFFGQNAWMPDVIGTTVLNGKLDQNWGNIKNSNASLIRYGGIIVDRDKPTNAQYLKIIDSVRANGMEPVIQVPYNAGQYTAQQAAAVVTYINVTMGRHVKYWIISNEPNLGFGYTNASQIANYFKPFASAMKNVDPSILIVGPEVAWLDQNIMNGLTNPGGPDDITGKDASGRYYLDVISFHTYPFSGGQTRTDLITKLTSSGGLQSNLTYLNSKVAACNSFHGRTGASVLKTAITEANVDYQNPTSDNINGLGVNSFIGGQFMAEMFGIGLKNSVDFINVWSVIEGNGLGYMDNSTGKKKPLYYHFKMLAENFSGTYADGTTNQANVKSFGCKDGQHIAVLVMNEDQSNNYNYTVRLNTSPASGSNALKININAAVPTEYTDVISNQSSVLLVFNTSGTIIKKYVYSLNGNATADIGPTLTEFMTTGIASTVNENKVPFEIKSIFPNPTIGKFTVELNQANSDGKNFEVQLYNIVGQKVYDKKSIFPNGKEDILLDPSVANGEYIIRIKEEEKDKYLTKKIILQK
jgi:hypothetical protein